MRNIDTFNEEYFGHYVVKEDKRSGCHNAAAIIMCFAAGQIALGAPGPKMKSNGELTLCDNLVNLTRRRGVRCMATPSTSR